MIKLIASDLDGTLLQNGSQPLPEGICDQIRRLKEKGILFVAASGRQYANLRRLFAPVQDDIAYICENGCLVFYKGKLLYKAHMEREIGQRILKDIMADEKAEVVLSGEDTSYLQPKNDVFRYHIQEEVKNNVTVAEDILKTEEAYFKISLFTPEGAENVYPLWKDKYGQEVTVVTSGNAWVDMMPKGVNKGTAMEALLEHLKIMPEECMAFGDNYNDLEMLGMVGESYAMSQGKDAVKKICKYQADTVGQVLETFLNTKEGKEENHGTLQ